MKKTSLVILPLMLPGIISHQALAHGWTDYPKARQTICAEGPGIWWPIDGSGIPNLACRAAFHKSGTYQFQQKNEFSANVSKYKDINRVKEVVKDGLICSAGDTRKSGISIGSADWQRTTMKSGEIFTLRYRATETHTPHFWEFYLSKPGYDANNPLTWNDLEKIHSTDGLTTVKESSGNYYLVNITLPKRRTGDATLMTRWQRVDPKGEGFYDCSDIRFEGGRIYP